MDLSGRSTPSRDSLEKNFPRVDDSRYPVQISKLRPEELKMYKKCSSSMYYSAGLPFAVLCQVVSSTFFPSVKVEPPLQKFVRRGFIFLGNMLLGTFLIGGPYCYNKLLKMHQEYERQAKDSDVQMPTVVEGVHPVTQTEDFSYPTALAGSFNEPEGNFSSDFTFPRISTEDDEKIKAPTTTYQELRMKHRNSQTPSTSRVTAPSVYNEPELPLSGLSAPIDQPILSEPPPPRKIVKRNKYGDEIE